MQDLYIFLLKSATHLMLFITLIRQFFALAFSTAPPCHDHKLWGMEMWLEIAPIKLSPVWAMMNLISTWFDIKGIIVALSYVQYNMLQDDDKRGQTAMVCRAKKLPGPSTSDETSQSSNKPEDAVTDSESDENKAQLHDISMSGKGMKRAQQPGYPNYLQASVSTSISKLTSTSMPGSPSAIPLSFQHPQWLLVSLWESTIVRCKRKLMLSLFQNGFVNRLCSSMICTQLEKPVLMADWSFWLLWAPVASMYCCSFALLRSSGSLWTERLFPALCQSIWSLDYKCCWDDRLLTTKFASASECRF